MLTGICCRIGERNLAAVSTVVGASHCFYWSIVDLQWCVSFRGIAKWINYTSTHIHSYPFFLILRWACYLFVSKILNLDSWPWLFTFSVHAFLTSPDLGYRSLLWHRIFCALVPFLSGVTLFLCGLTCPAFTSDYFYPLWLGKGGCRPQCYQTIPLNLSWLPAPGVATSLFNSEITVATPGAGRSIFMGTDNQVVAWHDLAHLPTDL